MQLDSNQLRGTVLVALSGMLYGLLGYLGTKILKENFSIESMLFWRFLFATFWMSFILFKKKNISAKFNINQSFIKLISFSAITYSGSSAFYFLATQQIGTGPSMVIFFSYPIFIMLFAWILNNWEINKFTIISLFMLVIGLIFLKDQGKNTLNLFGVLFAIIASLFYAIYVFGSQHSARMTNSTLLTTLICLANTFIFLILACISNRFAYPHTLTTWLYIGAVGIIATALPIQLLLDGLKYISPIKASILSVLEPVVTVIMGLLFLNETLSFMQSIGVIVILFAAIMIQFESISDPFVQRGD